MNYGSLVFAQILELLGREQIQRCFRKHPMPRTSRGFSARDQFLSMVFAQLTFRDSLRDIEACLRGSPHLHAMGIRGNVTRTNLAYANEHRNWRVHAAIAELLLAKARRLYAAESHGLEIDEIVYALDATTIDLCLAMFPWAHFRRTKAAIKLHTLIDLRGTLPTFIHITDGSVHDVNVLDVIPFEPGGIYVMDRGYIDFARLHRLGEAGAWFVTRAKSSMSYRVCESRPVDRTTGLRCDQTIRLKTAKSRGHHPGKLRRIRYLDPDTGRILTFLTNHHHLPALTVSAIYRSRWQIELFFKWIKQNLRIKTFYGTSENAVKTQIWIAVCAYLLVACLKKVHGIGESLSRILQIISVNVFQKVTVDQLFAESTRKKPELSDRNQLTFNWS